MIHRHISVKIEKTKLATKLEKELGISWDLKTHAAHDAGYDLRAAISKPIILGFGDRVLIPTGLHMQLEDPHWEIQIRPRSGLAYKHGITVLNTPGTVDYTYREEVKVILINLDGRISYQVSPGDRIAQACFRPIPEVCFFTDSIDKTDRSGFGSSGK